MASDHGGWRALLEPGPRLRSAVRTLLDTVMPAPSLDHEADPAVAWSRVRFLEDPVCDGCGLGFDYQVDRLGTARCPACLARPHRFGRARAACVYDEASRGVILAFKHGDRLEYRPMLTRWLSRAAEPLIAEADLVVPVPLHRLRLMSRRFNQAAELARLLARLRGLDVLPDALERRRATASQGGKSGRGRRLNLKGAIAVPEARRRLIKGRHILLVDDVLTTGATADACAAALLHAGARAVDLAVIARVPSRQDVTI